MTKFALLVYLLYILSAAIVFHFWGPMPVLLLMIPCWCAGALYGWDRGWNAGWEYALGRMPSEKRKRLD